MPLDNRRQKTDNIKMIEKTYKSIILTNFDNFDAKSILECGQVFRYNFDGEFYHVYSLDKHAKILQKANYIEIFTDEVDYFYNYFDLDTDYSVICQTVSGYNTIMSQAVDYGRGTRILNQDLTEMIFSFIISANNNIKRIQQIIERICINLGQKTNYGYAFPTVTALADCSEEQFKLLGCGYRANYLCATAKRLKDGFNLEKLRQTPTEDARKSLLSLKGIGNKVADCILLFGLKRCDVFPVDTWIEKVYHAYFEQGHKKAQMSNFFVDTFGEYSGYAQQYLFYFQRESMDKRI